MYLCICFVPGLRSKYRKVSIYPCKSTCIHLYHNPCLPVPIIGHLYLFKFSSTHASAYLLVQLAYPSPCLSLSVYPPLNLDTHMNLHICPSVGLSVHLLFTPICMLGKLACAFEFKCLSHPLPFYVHPNNIRQHYNSVYAKPRISKPSFSPIYRFLYLCIFKCTCLSICFTYASACQCLHNVSLHLNTHLPSHSPMHLDAHLSASLPTLAFDPFLPFSISTYHSLPIHRFISRLPVYASICVCHLSMDLPSCPSLSRSSN